MIKNIEFSHVFASKIHILYVNPIFRQAQQRRSRSRVVGAGLVPEGRPRPPKQRVFCIFLNVRRSFRANWGNNQFCSRFEGEVQLGFIFGTGNHPKSSQSLQ